MRSPRRGDGLNIRQQWPSSCVLNSCFCLIQRQRRRHQTETWGGNSVAACGHCCPSNLTVPFPMASSVFLIFLELAFFFFFSISDGSGHHQVGDRDGWSSCLFYLLCQKSSRHWWITISGIDQRASNYDFFGHDSSSLLQFLRHPICYSSKLSFSILIVLLWAWKVYQDPNFLQLIRVCFFADCHFQ